MKVQPILFSGPMVRAILAGQKTQTRRIARPKRSVEPMTDECPYGDVGGRLWVKEAIARFDWIDGGETSVEYVATPGVLHEDAEWVWKRAKLPGMFMPRGLSRITLEITEVRVQRLQGINVADAWAEGLPMSPDVNPIHEYEALWTSINGADSWTQNPWVWAITFRRIS